MVRTGREQHSGPACRRPAGLESRRRMRASTKAGPPGDIAVWNPPDPRPPRRPPPLPRRASPRAADAPSPKTSAVLRRRTHSRERKETSGQRDHPAASTATRPGPGPSGRSRVRRSELSPVRTPVEDAPPALGSSPFRNPRSRRAVRARRGPSPGRSGPRSPPPCRPLWPRPRPPRALKGQAGTNTAPSPARAAAAIPTPPRRAAVDLATTVATIGILGGRRTGSAGLPKLGSSRSVVGMPELEQQQGKSASD